MALVLAQFAVVAMEPPADGPAAMPPKITGWLHTKTGDTRIYDAQGDPVRLIGMADFGMASDNRQGSREPDRYHRFWRFPPTNCYDNLARWGFDSYRVCLSWANLEPTPPTRGSDGKWIHHWNQTYLDGVRKLVGEFGQRHLGVILNMHHYCWSPAFRRIQMYRGGTYGEGVGMPAWLYPKAPELCSYRDLHRAQVDFLYNTSEAGADAILPLDGFVEAWKTVVSEFTNNPSVIGIDILNEPSVGNPNQSREGPLERMYARVAKEVSAVNPRLLIIFEDVVKTTANRPILVGPPRVPNCVYSLHIYTPDWQACEPWLAAHVANARRWGIPLWLGEFNAFNGARTAGSQSGELWTSSLGKLLAYCRANDVSWCFWAYVGVDSILDRQTMKPKGILLSALQAGF